MDPLTIVARSHDLVLRNRVRGYARDGLATALFRDRVCFEYGGVLAAHPIAILPHWRNHMQSRREQPKAVAARAALGDDGARILSIIRDGGPMSARQVTAALGPAQAEGATGPRGNGRKGTYRNQSVTGQGLYQLWLGGDLMTSNRDGFERIYDLPERVAPADLLAPASRSASDAFFAEETIRRSIITSRGAFRSGLGYYQQRVVSAAEANTIVDGMIARGQVTAIRIEGLRGSHLVPTDLFTRLDHLERETGRTSEVRLLSPLDVLVSRWARTLFGFDHVWEIYKPPARRRWGPFTMPIVFGDALVGRIDARTDRAQGTLVVNGVWIEQDGLASDPTFIAALGQELDDLAAFVGVDGTEIVQTDPPSVRAPLARAVAG